MRPCKLRPQQLRRPTAAPNCGDFVELNSFGPFPNPGRMEACTLDGPRTRVATLFWHDDAWRTFRDVLTLDRERFARGDSTDGEWLHYRFRPGQPVPDEDGDGAAGEVLADDRLVLLPREAWAMLNDEPKSLVDRVGDRLVASRSVLEPRHDAETVERTTWMHGGHVTAFERWFLTAGKNVGSVARHIVAGRPTLLRPPETFRTVEIEEFEELACWAALDIWDED